MREQILAIVGRHQKVERLFAFENIPLHKLWWAKVKFFRFGEKATQFRLGSEQVLLLYAIANGHGGFLLTPTRLFYHRPNYQEVIKLQNITAISFDSLVTSHSKGATIKLATNLGVSRLTVWDYPPKSGDVTANILKHSIEALTGRSLGKDMSPVEPPKEKVAEKQVIQEEPKQKQDCDCATERLVECRGCGARYVGGGAACQFCRTPV